MLEDINNIIIAATKTLRPGTIEYKMKDIDSIDLSLYRDSLLCMLRTQNCFIRSINVNKEILIQDPKQYHRETVDTLHYHEYYIDNSAYWEDYPKRYNSLMFLSYNTDNYSGGFPTEVDFGRNTYYVFPETGSKIAISPDIDFISSFDFGFQDLYEFNALLRRMYIDIIGDDFKPTSYDEWADMLYNMQKKFKMKSKIMKDYISIKELSNSIGMEVESFCKILLSSSLDDFIENLFNPDEQEFNYITCSSNNLNTVPDNRECWTDGTCLLIRHDVFDKLTQPVKNNLFDKIAAL